MSVPAPISADTNDERDEGGEGDGALEERCRIECACIPPNHEIFTSQEMSAVSPVSQSHPLRSGGDVIPRKGEGRSAIGAFIPASFRMRYRGESRHGPSPDRGTLRSQCQRQPAPEPTTSAATATRAMDARAYQRITRCSPPLRWPQLSRGADSSFRSRTSRHPQEA